MAPGMAALFPSMALSFPIHHFNTGVCHANLKNQSRTNGPINAHLTIAQVMPKYNHNNEKQEALL